MKVSTRFKRKFVVFLTAFICVAAAITSSPVFAGKADVIDVVIKKTEADMYRFSVTVLHDDAGWDHYADRWDVLDEKGTILGTRVLMHPHDHEQPFTRSMKLSIPMHVKTVTIRARDKKDGYGGEVITKKLPD
ncbi:hypothetical protein [Sneathiella sp.]|jgi:hypothetical protein|uniref:hypothetical protein n=1 Tax=Sneathiella sp. TaxID=1964365 RepID=UPI0039E4E788